VFAESRLIATAKVFKIDETFIYARPCQTYVCPGVATHAYIVSLNGV
jgi:hypothetical protein